jgi:transposase
VKYRRLKKSLKKNPMLTSKEIKTKLKLQLSKMTTLYWKESRIQTVTLPGSSPDINPIEICFSFVKSKLEKEDTRYVLKRKGGMTKY